MKNVLLLAALCAPFFFFNCDSDDDSPDQNCLIAYNEDVAAASTAYTDAANTYVADPSTANCEALRSAGNNLVDTYERYEDCAGINQAEYQMQLDEARAGIAAITC